MTNRQDPIDTTRSVVGTGYKAKYAERAENARGRKGVSRKVISRSCGDWLSLELAAHYLTEMEEVVGQDEDGNDVTRIRQVLDVPAFEAMLDANGIEHRKWNRTTPGWQGRLRMTGRLALQRVVAEEGTLTHADGSLAKAPTSWCRQIAR